MPGLVVFRFDVLKDGIRKKRHLFFLKMMQKHLAAKLRCARLGFFPQEMLVAGGAKPQPWCVGCANPMAGADPGDMWSICLMQAASRHSTYMFLLVRNNGTSLLLWGFFVCFSPCVAGLQEGNSTALASCFSELFLACTFTNKKRNLQLKALALTDSLRLNIGWAKYRWG